MSAPHILISGAGIGGLLAGLALAQNGARVEIFERSTELQEIGAGLQLGPNAMHVLHALGLSDSIQAEAFEPESIAIRHYKSGKPLLSTPLKGAHEARYGQKYLHIHRADLQNILAEAAEDAGVAVHLGQEIRNYEQDKDSVRFDTQSQSRSGDILIGADGIKSAIRRHMLGPENNSFTGNVAWRGLVPTKDLPPNLIPPCANNWVGPERHFVSYYVRGGDYVNFIAVEERDIWVEESWSQPGNLETLKEAFKDWDSRLTTLLEACEHCYLWGLFDHSPLAGWTDNRVALLGDAAHPMLPFLAQGAAMAIEDSWVLAQCISVQTHDPLSALKAYEKARYRRASAVQAKSRDNAKLYHMAPSLQSAYRNAKFKIASHFPPAAHFELDKIFAANVVKDFPNTEII